MIVFETWDRKTLIIKKTESKKFRASKGMLHKYGQKGVDFLEEITNFDVIIFKPERWLKLVILSQVVSFDQNQPRSQFVSLKMLDLRA